MKLNRWTWRLGFSLALLNPSYALSVDSEYTDLSGKACKVIKQDKESSWQEEECPGVSDYKLRVFTDDDRDDLTLVQNGQEQPLNLDDHITQTFNHLGDKVEWRLRQRKPFALIVRLYFQNLDTNKPEERLIVAGVQTQGSCVTHVIDASKHASANELARQAAESADVDPCLWNAGQK